MFSYSVQYVHVALLLLKFHLGVDKNSFVNYKNDKNTGCVYKHNTWHFNMLRKVVQESVDDKQ